MLKLFQSLLWWGWLVTVWLCIHPAYIYDSLKRCCLEHLWNSSAPHYSLTIMSKGKFFSRSERSTQALSRLICHLKSFPPEAGSVYPKCGGQVYMAGIYQEHYCQKTKKNTQKKHNKIMSPSKASVRDIFDNMVFSRKYLYKLEFRRSLSQIYHVGIF